jgi:hypothetical protein
MLEEMQFFAAGTSGGNLSRVQLGPVQVLPNGLQLGFDRREAGEHERIDVLAPE